MENDTQERTFLKSVRGKVLFGFLIAIGALTASYFIVRGTFQKVEETVAEISTPDEKLRLINEVFQDILIMNQFQNDLQINEPSRGGSAQAIRKSYLEQSVKLAERLDTLSTWLSASPMQLARLDSIRDMLEKRAVAFEDYLRERQGMAASADLRKKVSSISELIETSKDAKVDSTVVTTEKRTTTTTITQKLPETEEKKEAFQVAEESKKGLFSKIFKGKKNRDAEAAAAAEEPVIVKKEEIKVSVDTVTVAHSDSAIQVVGEEIRNIAQNQIVQASRFFARERQLQLGENLLIGKVLELIREVEAEVLTSTRMENDRIKQTISLSLRDIGYILLAVSILTGILIIWIFADITKSNQYRKQLLLAKEEADYHSEAKQRFLANMSHEIRTPLQSIIGFSELAMRQKQPSRDQLEMIHKSSEHLLYLVNEILDYSRIISDRFEFAEESFEIGQLLHEVVEILKPQALGKGLELELVNKFPDPTFVLGDPFRLKQILHNLLGNAIKFTREGSVRLRAEPVSKNGQKEILVEVRDTGIGMTPDQIKRIFNQFEQGHSGITPEYGGAGLGLSIVKALVTGQGGRIQVESKVNEYSSFTLHIPFREGTPIEKIAVNQEEEAGEFRFHGKVWVIDDDKYILQWVRVVLEQNGVAVSSFSSPLDADKAPWDEDVKVVFVDMRMPDMSGPELFRKLKTRAGSSVHFIACTAMALPEEKSHILEIGFDEVLMKPFKTEDILRVLNIFLDGGPSVKPYPKEEEHLSDVSESASESKIDLSNLISMTMGDEQLLRDSLEQFVEDTLADLSSVEDCLKLTGTEGNLRELFHRLAGRTGQVGAMELAVRMREMELTLAAGNPVDEGEIGNIIRNGYELVGEIQEKYVS